MPVTKSAKETLRNSRRKRVMNLRNEKNLKNLLKEVEILISQKKTDEAKKLLPKVYKVLDKSAKTNLIKKNTASRKKSRIAKAIAKSQQ
jgi:small subunit ribosomal protein S20